MNRLRMGVALLSCAALFSCGLFAPTDGTVLNHSYDSTAYQLFWQNPGKPVQLQCQADGAWVTFATAQIGTPILATGSPGLYGTSLNAVIPEGCWKVAPAGMAGAYTATIQAVVYDSAPPGSRRRPTRRRRSSACSTTAGMQTTPRRRI